MDQFIPQAMLDLLSYRSTLGQSLKQISLRKTPLEIILYDIAKYRSGYTDILIQENLIGSRFKSEDSILRKYQKRFVQMEASNSVSMIFWDSDYTLTSTRKTFLRTFGL